MTITFIANSTRRYKYYQHISEYMGTNATVKFTVLPTLALFWGIFVTPPVSKETLMASHLRRQKINYPKLAQYTWLWMVYCYLAYLIEKARFFHYRSIFKNITSDAVAIWNGQKQPYLTMVEAAKSVNKKILFLENGLLPNTTTADYAGVNAKNSLPQQAQFYRQLTVTQPINAASLIPRKPHKHRQQTEQRLEQLPKRFWFIPFQVPADSQIVIHSPWIESMEQLFFTLLKVHKQLRKQWELEDIPFLIFKEHPSWPGHFSDLYQEDSYCLFANENLTQDLIEQSELVITINSTVGLEALLLNKRVLTLGNSCYNIEELVAHANNETELYEILKQLDLWKLDQTLRDQFLYFIKYYYCIPSSWETEIEQPSQNHLQAMAARILKQDKLAKLLK